MGGCCIEPDCEQGAADGNIINVVLLGRTGNGKSATGNSILRKKAFVTKSWFRSVTTTCQQQQIALDDGAILNVIDTPGLFDPSHNFKYLAKEISRCVSMAVGGIHAVLIVLSLNRFTDEEAAVVGQLQVIFGNEICDYMILVFTHGDDLEEGENFDDRLADTPESLKELLQKCGNRKVVFDNRTRDASKRSEQFSQLQDLIDDIANGNDNNPYTNEFFEEYQKGLKQEQLLLRKLAESRSADERAELEMLLKNTKDGQIQTLALMVISKLSKLNEELVRSNAKVTQLERAMKKGEEDAEAEKKRHQDEIDRMKEELRHWRCTIM